MSACLCRVGTGVLRCLFGFTLFQVNKILCLVCVCRAYAWLVTCPQVLTDGLCFVRELLKCNFSYISSATVGFIHMQTEGILPAAQWMARLGLLREPLTEIALHVAFYIKKKKNAAKRATTFQLWCRTIRMDHLADPSAWPSLQGPVSSDTRREAMRE